MLLLGLFASAEVNPAIASTFKSHGNIQSLVGGFHQIGFQAIGIVSTAILSGMATIVILKLVDVLVGLRVSEEEESAGLDVSLHGEAAYNE